jgi:hypothetical protein
MASTTSKPSRPGMRTSRKTTSGLSRAMASRASSHVAARALPHHLYRRIGRLQSRAHRAPGADASVVHDQRPHQDDAAWKGSQSATRPPGPSPISSRPRSP